MMQYLIAMPILVPIFASVLCILLYKTLHLQRLIALFATGAMAVFGGTLLHTVMPANGVVMYIGNWAPPFGINIVADHLSSLLVFVAGLIGFTAMLYSLKDIDETMVRRGFYPIALLMLAGVNGAFLTGDIFNLYVWFEIILITSFGLMMLRRSKKILEGAIKYVALNLVKTILFLVSVGMLYGITGTLNMADLHFAVQDIFANGDPRSLRVVGMMLLLAFGIKAGVFPLYFWLPASYHLPNSTIGALFAALLTKVGVYSILRVFTIILPADQLELQSFITVIAIATMLFAIVGAAADNHIRRILSFCLLSHIGSMLIGVAVFTVESFEGMVFYMTHHILVMACLFYATGVFSKLAGSDYLSDMGGLAKRAPLAVWLFFIAAIALAGVPPLSGFWGKFMLTKAALDGQHYALAVSLIITGFLTLYAMLRIWHSAVWRNPPEHGAALQENTHASGYLWLPVVILLVPIIYIGLNPEWLVGISRIAAYNSIDATNYVGLVLGGK